VNLGVYKWVMALWNAEAGNLSYSYHDLLDQQVLFPPPFCHCLCDIIRRSWAVCFSCAYLYVLIVRMVL
jgi:hypothetical protein